MWKAAKGYGLTEASATTLREGQGTWEQVMEDRKEGQGEADLGGLHTPLGASDPLINLGSSLESPATSQNADARIPPPTPHSD